VVGSEVLPASRFFDIVREHVGAIEADGASEEVTDADAIFTSDLVGDAARGVSLKGEVDELKHGAQIVARVFWGDVEVEGVGLDDGEWGIDPFSGFLDLLLCLAHGL